MKLSEFKVGDLVVAKGSDYFWKVRLRGKAETVLEGEHEELICMLSYTDDWEPYLFPKKTKRVAPYFLRLDSGDYWLSSVMVENKKEAQRRCRESEVIFPAKLADGAELWFEVPEE